MQLDELIATIVLDARGDYIGNTNLRAEREAENNIEVFKESNQLD